MNERKHIMKLIIKDILPPAILSVAMLCMGCLLGGCEEDRPHYVFPPGVLTPEEDGGPVTSPITIDGDLSDWDDIPVLAQRIGDDGILTEIKATSDKNTIYFYMKGDDSFYGYVQLYLNADGDPGTGWDWERHAGSAGADYEMDATTDAGELYPWSGEDGGTEWAFEGEPITDAELYTGSQPSGNAMEFSLSRAYIPGLATTISFALGDVDLGPDGEGWDEHGSLPSEGEGFATLELE